jgi:hypothetical protein
MLSTLSPRYPEPRAVHMTDLKPSREQTVSTTRLEDPPIVTGIRIREPGPKSRLPTRAVLIGTWRPSPKENRRPYAVWASIDNTKRVNRRIVAEDTEGYVLRGQRRCAARHDDIDYIPEFKGLSDNEVKSKVFSVLGEALPAGLPTLASGVVDVVPTVHLQGPVNADAPTHTAAVSLQQPPQEGKPRLSSTYLGKPEERLHCPSCSDRTHCGSIGDGWIGSWLAPVLIKAHELQPNSDAQWTPMHCQTCPTQAHGRECAGVSQWNLIGWIISTLGSVSRL